MRVRPQLAAEGGQKSTIEVGAGGSAQSVRISNPRRRGEQFQRDYDKVFPPATTQGEVFDWLEGYALSALQGFNATIMAYGPTGSGKTFTMCGSRWTSAGTARGAAKEGDTAGKPSRRSNGIIPTSLRYLFDRAAAAGDPSIAASEAGGWVPLSTEFQCCFFEIYNEKVYDLLAAAGAASRGEVGADLSALPVREHTDGQVVVQGLQMIPIASAVEAVALFDAASKQRALRNTSINLHSSRSHAVFQIHVVRRYTNAAAARAAGGRAGSSSSTESGQSAVRLSKLNLVDLAGNERWEGTMADDSEHTSELQHINRSLHALAHCIMTLGETGRSHVPYRTSTLTRILQDSLGGASRGAFVVCVSPALSAFAPAWSALKFADTARRVVVRAAANKVHTQDKVSRLRVHYERQLATLRQEVAELRGRLRRRGHSEGSGGADSAQLTLGGPPSPSPPPALGAGRDAPTRPHEPVAHSPPRRVPEMDGAAQASPANRSRLRAPMASPPRSSPTATPITSVHPIASSDFQDVGFRPDPSAGTTGGGAANRRAREAARPATQDQPQQATKPARAPVSYRKPAVPRQRRRSGTARRRTAVSARARAAVPTKPSHPRTDPAPRRHRSAPRRPNGQQQRRDAPRQRRRPRSPSTGDDYDAGGGYYRDRHGGARGSRSTRDEEWEVEADADGRVFVPQPTRRSRGRTQSAAPARRGRPSASHVGTSGSSERGMYAAYGQRPDGRPSGAHDREHAAYPGAPRSYGRDSYGHSDRREYHEHAGGDDDSGLDSDEEAELLRQIAEEERALFEAMAALNASSESRQIAAAVRALPPPMRKAAWTHMTEAREEAMSGHVRRDRPAIRAVAQPVDARQHHVRPHPHARGGEGSPPRHTGGAGYGQASPVTALRRAVHFDGEGDSVDGVAGGSGAGRQGRGGRKALAALQQPGLRLTASAGSSGFSEHVVVPAKREEREEQAYEHREAMGGLRVSVMASAMAALTGSTTPEKADRHAALQAAQRWRNIVGPVPDARDVIARTSAGGVTSTSTSARANAGVSAQRGGRSRSPPKRRSERPETEPSAQARSAPPRRGRRIVEVSSTEHARKATPGDVDAATLALAERDKEDAATAADESPPKKQSFAARVMQRFAWGKRSPKSDEQKKPPAAAAPAAEAQPSPAGATPEAAPATGRGRQQRRRPTSGADAGAASAHRPKVKGRPDSGKAQAATRDTGDAASKIPRRQPNQKWRGPAAAAAYERLFGEGKSDDSVGVATQGAKKRTPAADKSEGSTADKWVASSQGPAPRSRRREHNAAVAAPVASPMRSPVPRPDQHRRFEQQRTQPHTQHTGASTSPRDRTPLSGGSDSSLDRLLARDASPIRIPNRSAALAQDFDPTATPSPKGARRGALGPASAATGRRVHAKLASKSPAGGARRKQGAAKDTEFRSQLDTYIAGV